MKELLLKIAPGLASLLGGPLAGIAAGFIADKIGLPEKSVEAVQNAIAGMTGAELVKLKEIEADLIKHLAENGIKIDLAQIEVNKEEAKSESVWIKGWRPFVGWVGGAGFAYTAIVEPILRFIAQVIFNYKGLFPAIDTMLTMQVLFGLLGLGALRSWDKKNGNGNGH